MAPNGLKPQPAIVSWARTRGQICPETSSEHLTAAPLSQTVFSYSSCPNLLHRLKLHSQPHRKLCRGTSPGLDPRRPSSSQPLTASVSFLMKSSGSLAIIPSSAICSILSGSPDGSTKFCSDACGAQPAPVSLGYPCFWAQSKVRSK